MERIGLENWETNTNTNTNAASGTDFEQWQKNRAAELYQRSQAQIADHKAETRAASRDIVAFGLCLGTVLATLAAFAATPFGAMILRGH